ncbi:SDR family NAD(P)-dependent oxidoreductase [Actinomadura opuntiae]|uniref:SDR family NAD(P)-dependent oxidoreductase n=1 Tax=Actinomadura sp. OS1-43 TaxID=604315 RepID=UPI00255B09C5|nr:SDR family NAD(P)-dependent oxidoreductase [Actinomadura sp. OS1-43]MDL4814009.1 SDR family NAD(P)-dependent oxidoreductase [Actinomadura sp. OS1-43]
MVDDLGAVGGVGPVSAHALMIVGCVAATPVSSCMPAVPIRHAGRGDQHRRQQPEGVGDDQARRVAEDIRAAGGRAEAFAADVTEEAAVTDLVAQVTDRLGAITVLVVNATGPQPAVAVEDLTWEAHLDQLRFFVKSPTLLLQAVMPGMKAGGGGRVIQIGSDIFYGALSRSLPTWSLLGLLGLVTIPAGLAHDWPWLCVAVVGTGLLTSPTLSAVADAVSRLAPPSVRGEATGLQSSAQSAGYALGSPIVGMAIDVSVPAGGFAAAGLAGLATALTGCLLSLRRPPSRPPTSARRESARRTDATHAH